jgi:hypothetical protein
MVFNMHATNTGYAMSLARVGSTSMQHGCRGGKQALVQPSWVPLIGWHRRVEQQLLTQLCQQFCFSVRTWDNFIKHSLLQCCHTHHQLQQAAFPVSTAALATVITTTTCKDDLSCYRDTQTAGACKLPLDTTASFTIFAVKVVLVS